MNINKLFFITLVFVSIGLMNCTGFKQPAKNIDYYVLEYPMPVPNADIRMDVPISISIKRFSAAPYYNGNLIRFRELPFQMSSYRYHRWLAPPAEMTASFLTRDLRSILTPSSIVSQDDPMPYTHSLRAYVEDFYEDDTKDPWQAVLTLHVIFFDETKSELAERIVFQKWYKQVKPCDAKHPRALSKAMSEAMSDISASITEDIIRVVSTSE